VKFTNDLAASAKGGRVQSRGRHRHVVDQDDDLVPIVASGESVQGGGILMCDDELDVPLPGGPVRVDARIRELASVGAHSSPRRLLVLLQ
jgi:hypothetical protein